MSHTVIHSESGEKFLSPEQYANFTLLDPQEQTIGRIEEVFFDGGDNPEYVRVNVKHGLFRSKTVLIPVSFAEVDDGRRTLTLK